MNPIKDVGTCYRRRRRQKLVLETPEILEEGTNTDDVKNTDMKNRNADNSKVLPPKLTFIMS